MTSLCSSSSPPLPRQGWVLFHQLLIDLFKFLAPFLRNAELTKPTQLLYKVRHCPLSTLSLPTLLPFPHTLFLSHTLHASPHRILLSIFPSTHTSLPFQGTLRVLLVLLHDFPEFLCDYHFSFCDVIPPNCIQMRNLILSAFPRNMRLPDPFTPNLKVTRPLKVVR